MRIVADVMPREPLTAEGALLKAQITLPFDVDEAGDQRTTELIERYFRLWHDSPVGRIVRAMKCMLQAARTGDADMMSHACSDSFVAREQLPLSPLAWQVDQMVRAQAYHVCTSLGFHQDAENHRQAAVTLSDRLLENDLRGFASAHVNAALFLDYIGEVDRASDHWKAAAEAGLYGYYRAAYAQFLYRRRGLDDAREALSQDDVLCSWSRIVRATLLLDQANHRDFAIRELRSLAKEGCLDPVTAIALLAAAGESISESDVALGKPLIGSAAVTDRIQTAAARLFLESSSSNPVEFLREFGDQSMARFYVALKLVGDGKPSHEAIALLQQVVDRGHVQGSVYTTYCETLRTAMECNPRWPRCAESD